MPVTLKIAFNSITHSEVIIENPEYVPVLGDIVDIKAEDFIQDQKVIEQLALYSETGIWKVGLKMVNYSKRKTMVTIVLEEG
jgi:hypothetical protein